MERKIRRLQNEQAQAATPPSPSRLARQITQQQRCLDYRRRVLADPDWYIETGGEEPE